MDAKGTLMLCVSLLLALTRTLSSKKLSAVKFGTKGYFTVQTCFFGAGALLLLCTCLPSLRAPTCATVLLALGYAAALLCAQWGYTAALSRAGVSLTSTVYALAFVLPTVSGVLFFSETLKPLGICGIAVACVTVVLSGSKGAQTESDKKCGAVFPLFILMVIGSGGLGILQKVWQTTPESETQTSLFIALSFLASALISLLARPLARRDAEGARTEGPLLFSALIGGLAFSGCNILNTVLAGRVPGTLLFPLLNVGSILLTVGASALLLRERLRRREVLIVLLALCSILCLSFSRI